MIAACALGDRLRARHVGRRRIAAVAACRSPDPAIRAERLKALTSVDPASPLAWYLRGREAFRAGDRGSAARFFGMAHHLDPDLLSAALLTFTALKSAPTDSRDDDAWLRVLVETWREMNPPHPDFERADHAAWQHADDASPAPDDLSDLGRLAWIVAPDRSRTTIQDLRPRRPAWADDLFSRKGEPMR